MKANIKFWLLNALLIWVSFLWGAEWKVVPSPTDKNLRAIYADSSGRLCAVGDGGTIIRYEEGGWKLCTSPTAFSLHSVFFSSFNEGWAGGRAGILLHTIDGGENWEVKMCEPDSDLSIIIEGIYFSDSLHGVLTCTHGWGPEKDPNYPGHSSHIIGDPSVGGNHWSSVFLTEDGGILLVERFVPTNFYLHGLYFFSNTKGVLGTSSDSLYHPFPHHDGDIWYTSNGIVYDYADDMMLPFDIYFAFDFIDENEGFTVGDAFVGASIKKTNNGGQSWGVPISAVPSNWYLGVNFPDPNNGWAVGRGGVIVHTTDQGNTWDSVGSPTPQDLHGVVFLDSTMGVAVGNDGVILHYGGIEGIEKNIDYFVTSIIQIYPNPFTTCTNVSFSISKGGPVAVKIYDITGRLVKVIGESWLEAGKHIINIKGETIPTGVNFLIFSHKTQIEKSIKIIKM